MADRETERSMLDRGETFPCPKCGHPVAKHHDWHLGHTDDRGLDT